MTILLSIVFLGIAGFFSRDTRELILILVIGIPLVFRTVWLENERKKFKIWAIEDRRKTAEFWRQIGG